MTQLAEAPAPVADAAPERPVFRHSLADEDQEFQYRPMPMSAVIGSVLALLSASALVAWMAIPVAVVAAVVCLVATIRIARSRREFSGLWLAAGGLVASLAFVVAGVVLTVQRYEQELPPGFQRVSFAREISAKGVGIGTEKGQSVLIIPDEVTALAGKPVYLKGFIYPGKRPYGLTQFVLCKDNAQCCFGGQPPITDMIGVTLTDGHTVDYNTALMGVAGTLRINTNYRGGSLERVHLLDAEHVEQALTSL